MKIDYSSVQTIRSMSRGHLENEYFKALKKLSEYTGKPVERLISKSSLPNYIDGLGSKVILINNQGLKTSIKNAITCYESHAMYELEALIRGVRNPTGLKTTRMVIDEANKFLKDRNFPLQKDSESSRNVKTLLHLCGFVFELSRCGVSKKVLRAWCNLKDTNNVPTEDLAKKTRDLLKFRIESLLIQFNVNYNLEENAWKSKN